MICAALVALVGGFGMGVDDVRSDVKRGWVEVDGILYVTRLMTPCGLACPKNPAIP
jgi:hypothetical protein